MSLIGNERRSEPRWERVATEQTAEKGEQSPVYSKWIADRIRARCDNTAARHRCHISTSTQSCHSSLRSESESERSGNSARACSPLSLPCSVLPVACCKSVLSVCHTFQSSSSGSPLASPLWKENVVLLLEGVKLRKRWAIPSTDNSSGSSTYVIRLRCTCKF